MKMTSTDFKRDPLSALRDIDGRTDRFLHLAIDNVNCTYINDPILIGEVLSKQWPKFRKEFGYKKSRDLIQEDLFSPKTVWPSPQEFASISESLGSIISDAFAQNSGSIKDLYGWCRTLTMRVFLETLLKGSVAAGVSQQELEDATLEVVDLLGEVILQFPLNIDHLDQVDLQSHERLTSYAQLFVQHPHCAEATPGRAMTTILAGYEQMASIMFWLLLHYSENPIGAGKEVGARQFLNEVIRLHSPIWTIMRRPKERIELDLCVLEADSVIITSPWLMARKSEFFPSAEKFYPERWNLDIPTFAFFPFSHGPRVCKGERFVRTAMYALLSELQGCNGIKIHTTSSEVAHLIRVSAIPLTNVQAEFR